MILRFGHTATRAHVSTHSAGWEGRVPELRNPVDGSIREARTFRFAEGRTRVPLKFGLYDSIFIFFRKAASAGRDTGPNFPIWTEARPITGPWEVAFDPRWSGPREPVRFDELKNWSAHDEPGIKYYSGRARYRTRLEIEENEFAEGRLLAVELGTVEDLEIARVILNGRDLGITWRPPFRVDITQAVKAGTNILEVEVVNSGRNRPFRDAQLPKEERLTRTNIKVQVWRSAVWKLEEAGLLGPVSLSVRTRE